MKRKEEAFERKIVKDYSVAKILVDDQNNLWRYETKNGKKVVCNYPPNPLFKTDFFEVYHLNDDSRTYLFSGKRKDGSRMEPIEFMIPASFENVKFESFLGDLFYSYKVYYGEYDGYSNTIYTILSKRKNTKNYEEVRLSKFGNLYAVREKIPGFLYVTFQDDVRSEAVNIYFKKKNGKYAAVSRNVAEAVLEAKSSMRQVKNKPKLPNLEKGEKYIHDVFSNWEEFDQ